MKSPCPAKPDGEMVGFEARSTIRRRNFGIDIGIPMISDEVDLEIAAVFTRK